MRPVRFIFACLLSVLAALPFSDASAYDPGETPYTSTTGGGGDGAPECDPFEGMPDCCPAAQQAILAFRDMVAKGDRNLIDPGQPLDILYPADDYGAHQPTPRHYRTTTPPVSGEGIHQSLATYSFITPARATPPASAPANLQCYPPGGSSDLYICGQANLTTNSRSIIDPSVTAACPRNMDYTTHPDVCMTPEEMIANYPVILDRLRALDCAGAVHAGFQLTGITNEAGNDASVFVTNSVGGQARRGTTVPMTGPGSCDPHNNWQGCRCGDVGITLGQGHTVMYSGAGTILHSNYGRDARGNGYPDMNGNSWDGPHEDSVTTRRGRYNYETVRRFVQCDASGNSTGTARVGALCAKYRRNASGQCVPVPCLGQIRLYDNVLTTTVTNLQAPFTSCYIPENPPAPQCLNAGTSEAKWDATTQGEMSRGSLPTPPACLTQPRTPRFSTSYLSATADGKRAERNQNAIPRASGTPGAENDRLHGWFYDFQAGQRTELGKDDADVATLMQSENRPPSYGCQSFAINKRQLSEQVDRFIANWMFTCAANPRIAAGGSSSASERPTALDGNCTRRFTTPVLPNAPKNVTEKMCQPIDVMAPTKRDSFVPAVEAIYDPMHPFGFRRTGLVGTYNNDFFSKKYNGNIICGKDPGNPNDRVGHPVDILRTRQSAWNSCTSCHANCFQPTDLEPVDGGDTPAVPGQPARMRPKQPQCSTCSDHCCAILENPLNEKTDDVILNVLKLRPTPMAWERDTRWPDAEWVFWRNFGNAESDARKPAMMWWDTGFPSCRYPEDTLVGVGVEHENCGYGGWEELKLYQANCMKYFRLGCICKYEETFKQGSAEEYVHRRSGATYWDYRTEEKQRFEIGAGTSRYSDIQPIVQQWPLAWRGYVGYGHATLIGKPYGSAERAAIVGKRFPFQGLLDDSRRTPRDPEAYLAQQGAWYDPNNPSLNTGPFFAALSQGSGSGSGLSNAKVGDVIIWDDEVLNALTPGSWDETDRTYTLKDMRPHVAIVKSVHKRPDYVIVEEYNYGEFPDSCGNTTMWSKLGTRTLYRSADDIDTTAYTRQRLGALDCRNSKLKACEERYWSRIKIYRPWRDIRRGAKYGCDARVDALGLTTSTGLPFESTRGLEAVNYARRYPGGTCTESGDRILCRNPDKRDEVDTIFPYRSRRGGKDLLNNIASLVPGPNSYAASLARAAEIQQMINSDRAKGCDAPIAWSYETNIDTRSDEVRNRVAAGSVDTCIWNPDAPNVLPTNCYPTGMTAVGTTNFLNTTPTRPEATRGDDGSSSDPMCGVDPDREITHQTSFDYVDPQNPINPGYLIPPRSGGGDTNDGDAGGGNPPPAGGVRPPGSGSAGNPNPPQGGGAGSCTASTMSAEALTDPQTLLLAAKDLALRGSAIAPNARNVLAQSQTGAAVLRELSLTGDEGLAALLSAMRTLNMQPRQDSQDSASRANAEYAALSTALGGSGAASGQAMLASSAKIAYYLGRGLANEINAIITQALSSCRYTLPQATASNVQAQIAQIAAAVQAQSGVISGVGAQTAMDPLNQALTAASDISSKLKAVIELVEGQLRGNTQCFVGLAADRCRTEPTECYVGDLSIQAQSQTPDRPAGCSTPPNILTDNPSCFREGLEDADSRRPFCKANGTLVYTPASAADPLSPIADRSSPSYREEGYSQDFVVSHLEARFKSWLDIRETVRDGAQTTTATRREIMLGIAPKDWESYPFVKACTVANPAATGSLVERQTVAVFKSGRYPLGHAGIVWRYVSNAQGGPCIQVKASNWAAGRCDSGGACQSQLDQRNCFQSYPYFGLACTTMQCIPLSDVAYFLNPTPGCGVTATGAQ